ncbi:hypothetical protein A2961_03055 [Candidatus Woesebacteria bacterium RIFCSPLOWO2_01_FULL_39_21]|uniref:DUF5678 domain-containing protein n=1 Tax=Candidatus Woesebacteria bacterium RIFCSPLOWO2_01_FULL_39_21 TaxID=1802519 RepID=A0A1F8BH74_9BACT|nr:MAG: hypothetical protein A2691_02505 [Candidatus Woesebacteria bacterium RIFCSPHIGHO2_01_FULL_39_23]OGM63416.1 MAG: hypothetical protein A2961_03055 [Candidatus Woesebacteria bacterium RIFCSPLOWO2_01_FULL_39_21]
MKPISRVEVQRKYPGKWVAFKEDLVTVAGVGKTLKEAAEKATKSGTKIPYLMKIPKESLPYVGYNLHA